MTDDLRLPKTPRPLGVNLEELQGLPEWEDNLSIAPTYGGQPRDTRDKVIDESQVDDTPLWDDPIPTFTDLSGPAGSGKTFAAAAWARRDPSVLRCATTGIAAINLGGSTINSVLGYFDTASLQEHYLRGSLAVRMAKLNEQGIRRLVIDEKSMLSGDALGFLTQAVNDLNGRGYGLSTDVDGRDRMAITLVGDFAQLPPVKETYAFESPEWAPYAAHSIGLTTIHRQDDAAFIEALRAARLGDGKRVADYLALTGGFAKTDDNFEGTTILAKNAAVDRYNWMRMNKLPGASLIFTNTRWGKQRSEWGNPKKPPATWLIPERLPLKKGALVMVLANLRREGPPPQPYLYVNGDLGTVVDASPDDHWAQVKLQRTGSVETVTYVTREVKEKADKATRDALRAEGKEMQIDGDKVVVGAISYLPLRVAYASTVHKSQGLSLDTVQVNVSDGFFKTPGMVYVALSRARSRAGLHVVGDARMLIGRCTVDPKLKEWL